MPITQESPQDAFKSVLTHVKDLAPSRSEIQSTNGLSKRYVQAQQLTVQQRHQVTKPEDVGGWPELKSEPAPKDADGDGMPDECGESSRAQSQRRG